MNQLIKMLVAVVLTAFVFTGCVEDTCETLICKNGAECVNDACDCPDGFRGTECEEVIDPCENVTCEGEQTCENGVCGCSDGFEGLDCDVLAVAKFIGNWSAEDDCPSAGENYVYVYESKIDPFDGEQTKVEIFNFGDLAENFAWTADVSGDTIKVPLSEAGKYRAEGMGIITASRDSINWVYTVTTISDNSEEECIGLWKRL